MNKETIKKNTDTNHVKLGVWSRVFDMVDKIIEYAKTDFKSFAAKVAFLLPIGALLLKSAWYAYQSGRFSAYGVDTKYITYNNEFIFMQIIQLVAILIVWGILNYVFYIICTSDFLEKKKRIFMIFVFQAIEIMAVFIYVIISTGTGIDDLINAFSDENLCDKMIALIIMNILVVIAFNVFAISLLVEKKINENKKKKEQERKQSLQDKNQNCDNEVIEEKHKANFENDTFKLTARVISSVLVAMAFVNIGLYFGGFYNEKTRTIYDVALIECDNRCDKYRTMHYLENGILYERCPVIYENKDCYIVSKLYNDDGEIRLAYDYNKVIDKENVDILKIYDIYD